MSDAARPSQHSSPRSELRSFEFRSDLAIDASKFWLQACLTSVNWELAPIARMTSPKGWRDRPIATWEVGPELFKSWILLFGFLPIDRHAFRLRGLAPGSGFRESSSSWTNREWNHDRTICAHELGCTIVDRVEVLCRVPLITPLLLPIYRFTFWNRHRRLRAKYAAPLATMPQ